MVNPEGSTNKSVISRMYLILPTQGCTASTVNAITMDHDRNIVRNSHQKLHIATGAASSP